MIPLKFLSRLSAIPVSGSSPSYVAVRLSPWQVNQRCYSALSSSSSREEIERISKLANELEAQQTSSETAVTETEDGQDWVSNRGPLPLITGRPLSNVNPSRVPRQAWVENLDTLESKKLGLVDLHPDVFGTFPRVELIQANVKWQSLYNKVNWAWSPTRAEVKGPHSKPWPQKGTGRARHSDRRSPLWIKGGKAHGPRGPKTYFYMLPFYKRVHGLTSTLSVKLAQDDLHIVDNLEIPTTSPDYLHSLVDTRKWGISVLFVDDSDIAPKNLALATDTVSHMNIMPVYGLNVHSMLKHETLVLTLAALNKIEEKLIFHLNRNDPMPVTARKVKPAFV